jgi:hypothetical protein
VIGHPCPTCDTPQMGGMSRFSTKCWLSNGQIGAEFLNRTILIEPIEKLCWRQSRTVEAALIFVPPFSNLISIFASGQRHSKRRSHSSITLMSGSGTSLRSD